MTIIAWKESQLVNYDGNKVAAKQKMTTNTRRIFWLEAKKKNDEHPKRIVTVDTVKKSRKNAMLAKNAENDWLTYDRSGKHDTNFKSLLCCHYVKHIDKLKSLKSEWIEGSNNFCLQRIT